mgnify:CR=1 FL=1
MPPDRHSRAFWVMNGDEPRRAQGAQRTARDGLNTITGQIIDAAMKVHSALGPGVLESAYHACMRYELRKRGLRVRSQVKLPIVYDGVRIDAGYRIDLLVEECVLVELKAVTTRLPVHTAQLLSYLKLGDYRVGLLLNFHEQHMKDGIERLVNDF